MKTTSQRHALYVERVRKAPGIRYRGASVLCGMANNPAAVAKAKDVVRRAQRRHFELDECWRVPQCLNPADAVRALHEIGRSLEVSVDSILRITTKNLERMKGGAE